MGYVTVQDQTHSAAVFDLLDGKDGSLTVTLPAGTLSGRLCPLYIVAVGIDIVGGTGTNSPSIKIGNNSPNYDNVLASTRIDGVSSVDDCWLKLLPKQSIAVVQNQDLVLKISAASTATNYLFRVHLIGITS